MYRESDWALLTGALERSRREATEVQERNDLSKYRLPLIPTEIDTHGLDGAKAYSEKVSRATPPVGDPCEGGDAA